MACVQKVKRTADTVCTGSQVCSRVAEIRATCTAKAITAPPQSRCHLFEGAVYACARVHAWHLLSSWATKYPRAGERDGGAEAERLRIADMARMQEEQQPYDNSVHRLRRRAEVGACQYAMKRRCPAIR